MLHDAVLLGSRIFHEDEPLRDYYEAYFRDEGFSLVDEPERLDGARAARLIQFVNQWRTHYQATTPQLRDALKAVLPELCMLRDEAFLDVDLARPCNGPWTVGDVIERVFETVASCGRRYESTGASKILHMVHPRLFVMWDSAIAAGYATGRSGRDYAHDFLPLVQLVARRAVDEYERSRSALAGDAVSALCACGHTMARVIDEYNYAEFTLSRREVWVTELLNG